MKTRLLYSIMLFLLSSAAIAQQPTLEWAQRYSGKGNANATDVALAVAVDVEGNSYVTGSSQVDARQWIATVKYSPAGQQLWAVEYKENSNAVDIAVDNKGGVYITGTSNNDFITIRYDATTGEQSWIKLYDAVEGSLDAAAAITVDNTGGVYVTGSSLATPLSIGYATVRYDAVTGEQTWAQHYFSESGSNYATGITTDNSGSVYVTGTSYTFLEGAVISTFRYDAATGEQAWVQEFKGEYITNVASGIEVDNTGGLYITGFSYNVFSDADFTTIRYATETGRQTWARHFSMSGESDDQAAEIAVDNTGGVYVTGFSYTNESGSNYTTIRYNAATGEQAWVQHYDGAGAGDRAAAIAVDDAGGVYVTGTSQSNDLTTSYYATVRYNATTGEQVWVQQLNEAQFGYAEARDITVDDAGGVYVTGYSFGIGSVSFDFATVRYAAGTGEQTWVQYYNGTGITNTSDNAISVAVDAAGNSYVTGTSWINQFPQIVTIKYSPSGEELWVAPFEVNSHVSAIAVDNMGGVYVAGNSDNLYTTIRYDAATGEPTWVRKHENSGLARAIATDNAGSVYVTGTTYSSQTGSIFTTIRYEATTGEQIWERHYNESDNNDDYATAIAVDTAGKVFVTGTSYDPNSGYDYTTVAYATATGEQIWTNQYKGPAMRDDQASAIAIDNNNGVYVTGTSYNSDQTSVYTTVRYDATTGEQAWVQHYEETPSSSNNVRGIAVDNAGGVFVTGNSRGIDFGVNKIVTLRYDGTTGEQAWVQQYTGPTSSIASAIAVDNAGGVYVAGFTLSYSIYAAYVTIRHSALTGNIVWAEQYDGPLISDNIAVAIAVDQEGSVIVTGFSYNYEIGQDYLTIKYSQQAECPDITEVAITGLTSVQAGTSGSAYSLANTGATSFTWSITDSQGNAYTDFSGQGTSAISVNWPSSPDFLKLSVSYGAGPGGGCVAGTAVLYVRVFDPGAGFVTGGGWVESPANSNYEFMQESRRAHLSLVARYSTRKGNEEQVQGSTSLVLQAGSFTFRSTSYEEGSLVVTGNRAYYSGRGTLTRREGPGRPVTDEREFAFLVAATDGDSGAGAAEDRFRLKVWVINADGSPGAVVYDNQAGCVAASLEDNAGACSAMGGGNITIHKPVLRSIATGHSLAAEAQGLAVYPTAVSDRATVSFVLEQGGEYALELYDMRGALVKRIAAGAAAAGKRYEQEVSVEGMGKGLYLARLSTATKVQTVKLVVQR